MKKIFYLILPTILFAACSSNDDFTDGLEGTGITITDDVDCCSAEEARQVYNFLQTVKIIPELSTVVDDKYNVFAYSQTGSFHVGYNEIYFVAIKKASGNYVKNFDITGLTPLMHMTQMDMYHSTPVSPSVESFNDGYAAVKRGWISFVMNSGDSGTWSLSYATKVLGKEGSIKDQSVLVDALPEGQSWIKSFKVDDDPSLRDPQDKLGSGQANYYISLVNPTSWKTGTNTIQAFISQKNAASPTTAWGLAEREFTVEVVPTMPDMGNHTSPDNTPLTRQQDGSYQSTLNLTMTGLWRLHLTVKDIQGNTLAGGDNLSDGYSSLYLDVTL